MSNHGESYDVLVYGSAIIDFICYVPRLPLVGETLHGKKFCTGFGGKGANQCVAAARLGAKTAMVAKVGDDIWGKAYIENLSKENVNASAVAIVQGQSTGIAQINVADNGDNQIVIVTGANDLLSPDDVAKSNKIFDNAKILVCQLETPIKGTLEALRSFKGISILNFAPAVEEYPPEIIKFASILCLNEVEASLITKSDVKSVLDAKKAIAKLVDMGAKTVIITLGEKGAVYQEKNEGKVFHVKSVKVEKVLDTTGAGDAFIGALAYFLAKYQDEPLGRIIGAACKVAAYSVQSLGTQSSFPRASDVNINFKSATPECCEI